MINFDSIKPITPATLLDILEIPEAVYGSFVTVSVVVDGTEIFNDTFFSYAGKVKIYGIGDMIINAAGESFAPNCSITVTKANGGGQTKRFMAVVTKLEPALEDSIGYDNWFLNSAASSLCPTASEVVLSAVGSDIAVPIQPNLELFKVGGDPVIVEPERVGLGAVYRFFLPSEPGIYTATLGNRRHCFIVAEMPEAHRLEFRNPLNAPEILYLQAEVKAKNTRSVQLANVGGKAREYDVDLVDEFEFTAKDLKPMQSEVFKWMHYCNSFMFDGVPVVIQNLEISYSSENRENAEVKFTARIVGAPLVFSHGISDRIFQMPFNISFN